MAESYKLVDVPRILDIYNEVVACARELGYLEGVETPPLYWLEDGKAYGICWYSWQRMGTTEYTWWNHSGKRAIPKGILLSVGLRNSSEETLKTTLTHEVVHLCAVTRYGADGAGHGYYFKVIGPKLGYKLGVEVKTRDNFIDDEGYREHLKEKGNKVYDKLYLIIQGNVYLRARTFRDVTIKPEVVDSGKPFRRRWYYTNKEARDAKFEEIAAEKGYGPLTSTQKV